MIEFAINRHPSCCSGKGFSYEGTEIVRRLHRQVPGFAASQLKSLSVRAAQLGVKALLVKDESSRFGLNAFKGLGGIYAVFRVICRELELDPAKTTMDDLRQEPCAGRIREMVFATTTDGNHGKGVSWAPKVFGAKAYVYMPVGTVPVRAQAIRDAGSAEVTITDMHYDDCVAWTAQKARENGWHLVQDTSWEGYEEIPLWIMQGYTTMYFEALEQMRAMGYEAPTHIFLQAGVGSMAAAVAAAAMSEKTCGQLGTAVTVGVNNIDRPKTTAKVTDENFTSQPGSSCDGQTSGHPGTAAAISGSEGGRPGTAAASTEHGIFLKPVITTVESTEAACFYDSFEKGDGQPTAAHGSEQTIMAGLNCSVPCTLAWEILGKCAAGGFACADEVTCRGMRLLAHPTGTDPAIVSGESGAVTAGLVDTLLSDPGYEDIVRKLHLNKDSVILLFSTEGDTDPENYRRIVRDM